LQIPHLAHLPRTHDHLDAQAKQALRIRRFHMSVVTYFACGVFAQVCALLGYLPIWLPGVWAAGVFFANLVFYLMIYTGRTCGCAIRV
jgi:hypothetical protein